MKTFLAALLFLAALPASATELFSMEGTLIGETTISAQSMAKVPVREIGRLAQGPQEMEAAFMDRAALAFRSYSDAAGFEACALLCKAPTGHISLLVTTNQSHLGCVVVNACQEGSVSTEVAIHSHPPQRDYVVTPADQAFLNSRVPSHGKHRWTGAPKVGSTRSLVKSDGPSDVDLRGGEGWLVETDALYHLSRRGRLAALPLGKVHSEDAPASPSGSAAGVVPGAITTAD